MESLLSLNIHKLHQKTDQHWKSFCECLGNITRAVLTQTVSSGAFNHVSSFPLITLLSYTNFYSTISNPFPSMEDWMCSL